MKRMDADELMSILTDLRVDMCKFSTEMVEIVHGIEEVFEYEGGCEYSM